jgi:protein-disulfide isomerase-like protein with CxxC motif
VPVEAVLHTDPGCPWAYSANPALQALCWRFGDALRWRLVTIGLSETVAPGGITPAQQAQGWLIYRERFGMPFGRVPRSRRCATGRACRAIVATRLLHPGREFAALRALQFAWFTSTLLPDEDESLLEALRVVPEREAEGVLAALDDEAVRIAYERDREEARAAAGSATHAQGKAREESDGVVRYTAPSVRFLAGERVLEGGGFQPLAAYDALLANLDPGLPRRPPPADALEALRAFPDGLVTQEIAELLAPHLTDPDRRATEAMLIELSAAGAVTREALGDDALWRVAA